MRSAPADMLPEGLAEQLAEQLTTWLAETDIGGLELRGPGVALCLHNRGGQVQRLPPGSRFGAAAAATLSVSAPTVGVFLHRHPLHEADLAAPGRPLAAGQAIGLLQIGALLLPVVAPWAGHFAAYRVAAGTVVGYGTPLAELIPAPAPATAATPTA